MDYGKDILNRLIDSYERRKAFAKDTSNARAISLDINRVYPEYGNRYNHNVYKDINVAIDKLVMESFVVADKNNTGYYTKIKLSIDNIESCYKKLKRISIPKKCEKIEKILYNYLDSEHQILTRVVNDWLECISEYKKLPYDLQYDAKRIEEVLQVLNAILKLEEETYVRNFSTAHFRDSKRFQKEYRSVVESILFDYTDSIIEKESILEYYNLYENPTYVLIKGHVIIRYELSMIDVSEMPDGIALSNSSLDRISYIEVQSDRVITVENLTTYYDSDEEGAVFIYLGGFHNDSKQRLLKKLYSDNKNKYYYHKGDIDVYGFLILENLREKTGIPFEPLMMDKTTIERFYEAGLYKELTRADIKTIEKTKNNRLSSYQDVLEYMLDNNCKVEQESVKALELVVN